MEKGSRQTRCHGDQSAAPQFPWGGKGLPPHLSQNSDGIRRCGGVRRGSGEGRQSRAPLSSVRSGDKLRPRTRLLAKPRGDMSRGGPASDWELGCWLLRAMGVEEDAVRPTGRLQVKVPREKGRRERSGPPDCRAPRVCRAYGRAPGEKTEWSDTISVAERWLLRRGRGGPPDKRSWSQSGRSPGGGPRGVSRGAL